MPLVFAGAFFGFKQQLKEPPVRTNEIPRQIPLQAWYMSAPFTMLIGGILPFGAVFIELFFILSSIWLHQARRAAGLQVGLESASSRSLIGE